MSAIGTKQTTKNPSGVKGSAQVRKPDTTGQKANYKNVPYQKNGCR